jgi:hypothetical protein
MVKKVQSHSFSFNFSLQVVAEAIRKERKKNTESQLFCIIETMSYSTRQYTNNKASLPSRRESEAKLTDHEQLAPSAKRRIVDPVFGAKFATSHVGEWITQQVIDANNQGAECFKKGEYALALTLFESATAIRIGMRNAQFPTIDTTSLWLSASPSVPFLLESKPITSINDLPTSSYQYQRMDFDEGMDVYAGAEVLDFHDHRKLFSFLFFSKCAIDITISYFMCFVSTKKQLLLNRLCYSISLRRSGKWKYLMSR